ncbi:MULTISPECIES: hypothetical protein [unclassified Collinsella]|uniref:hypothetical protein n=1 Tax=unclassified Collinsella TaxID=2637548 RepID=UPI003F8BFAEB
MSARKKNRNRNTWSPQDDLAFEMAKRDEAAAAEDVKKAEAEQAKSSEAEAPNEEPVTSTIDETALLEREEALRSKQSNLDEREKEIKKREDALAEREAQIVEQGITLEAKASELEQLELDVVERETAVRKAESERDEGYRLAKSKHDQLLQDEDEKSKSTIAQREQEAIKALQENLARIRSEHDASLKEELKAARASIAAERASWKEEYKRQSAELATIRSEIDKQRGALDAQQSELDRRIEDFDLEQLGFDRQRKRFEDRLEEKEGKLDIIAEERAQARKDEFEALEQANRDERERLLKQLRTQDELLASYEELRRQLGGRSPQSVLAELDDLRGEIARLNDDIASGAAAQQMQSRIDDAENRYRSAVQRITQLQEERSADAADLMDFNEMYFKLQEAEQKLEYADRIAKNASGEVARLNQELERYQSAYEKPEAWQARVAEIEVPFIEIDTTIPEDGSPNPGRPAEPDEENPLGELEWLDGVYAACENYGLHFNPRLLKAFHTSLKTAEWSPLTVLAGVSGTGKSELPRLYAHFGGLYFASVAVQPNWDSKESMLGFFNSIENRFDAEPILHFLAQSQKDWVFTSEDTEGYPGLNEAVCLVLLDEMNLAHPELYFAEFLSKLEERRGRDRDHLPCLDVKIGTGMTHQIQLGRNVLWTGTMNQDETTKSLSDKVLDRSIVLNFPRPTELKRRASVKSLDEKNRGELLHIDTWNSWKVQSSQYHEKKNPTGFRDEEILPYKRFVEEMNEALGVVGRAIGHRVWQSVEYYMASYPEVRLNEFGSRDRKQAMHIAFEDQIVQKIMPKLRGIETSGESEKRCLIPIKNLLLRGVDMPFDLTEDFELACKLGYGQFVWQTANYLKDDSAQNDDER